MSRGTMLTDKWRVLNSDIFDMKLQVKVINDQVNRPNFIQPRIGLIQQINTSRQTHSFDSSNEDMKKGAGTQEMNANNRDTSTKGVGELDELRIGQQTHLIRKSMTEITDPSVPSIESGS